MCYLIPEWTHTQTQIGIRAHKLERIPIIRCCCRLTKAFKACVLLLRSVETIRLMDIRMTENGLLERLRERVFEEKIIHYFCAAVSLQ